MRNTPIKLDSLEGVGATGVWSLPRALTILFNFLIPLDHNINLQVRPSVSHNAHSIIKLREWNDRYGERESQDSELGT